MKRKESNSPASGGKRWMLGLGLDGKDGHLRLTKGENFRVLGGSDKTHAIMQEKIINFNEELGRRKKSLDDISRDEFEDLARETGLKDV